MIVPRDYAGQRQLWEQLSQVFGGNGPDPPGPDPPGPDPPGPDPPPPQPCVQDWKLWRWDNVISFRTSWDDLIRPGSFWEEPGMNPNSWYMLIEPHVKCLQIVRIIEYNKLEPNIELPGIDGILMLTGEDVPIFKGVSEPGVAVSFPGQPATYWIQIFYSEKFLTVDYHCLSNADPPAFEAVEGSLCWEVNQMHSVYLSLWNWGYRQYRPDMDRTVAITMFTKGWYPRQSERPKVMNV